jgi:hypothetical protein
MIVAIAAIGTVGQIGTVAAEGLPWQIAAAPALPGFYAALFLGLGRGAHGFPTQADVAPYLLAFVFWWLIIDQGRAWWQRRRTRTARSFPAK